MPESERILVRLLRELARERGWDFHAFSHDWILLLTRPDGFAFRVVGYDFPLNSATAHLAAKDKAAASDLLGHAGVPRIEHRLFHRPELAAYIGEAGTGAALREYFLRHDGDVVVKPNAGTGGRDVHRVRDIRALEERTLTLFASGRDACLSPFRRLRRECRVVMLDDAPLLAFRKRRPAVEGDGIHSVLALAVGRGWRPSGEALADLEASAAVWDEVPPVGARRPLNWRHNLGQGSRAEVLDDPPPVLIDLARRAMTGLGLRFASVDVAEVGPGPDAGWRGLEVNAGVMMESFARQQPDGLARARAVYAAALDRWVSSALPTPSPGSVSGRDGIDAG